MKSPWMAFTIGFGGGTAFTFALEGFTIGMCVMVLMLLVVIGMFTSPKDWVIDNDDPKPTTAAVHGEMNE